MRHKIIAESMHPPPPRYNKIFAAVPAFFEGALPRRTFPPPRQICVDSARRRP